MNVPKHIMPFIRIIVVAGLMFIVHGPAPVRAWCWECEFTDQGDPVCIQNTLGYDGCTEDVDNQQCDMGKDGCVSDID